MSYFYARKVEFVGNDGNTYHWYYECDNNGFSSKLMDQNFSYKLDQLDFDSKLAKRSKTMKVKDTESNRNKLMILCCKKPSVKKRFFKFLRDEGVFHMYYMNWKKDISFDDYRIKKIKDSSRYIIFAFRFFNCEYGSLGFWWKIDNKWQSILKNEGYAK